MNARTGSRSGTDRRRSRALTDGGETLCVACGEAYEANHNVCPACGHRPATNGTTDDRAPGSIGDDDSGSIGDDDSGSIGDDDSGSIGDDTAGSSTASAPDIGGGEDLSADGRSAEPRPTEMHTTGDGHADATIGAAASPPDRGRSDPNPTERSGTGKSPLVAALLSFILIGAGHVYIGEIKRGVGAFLGAIGISFVAVLTLGLGTPLILVVWGWAMYDAYTRAA